jgi:hypothetical protein
VQLWNLMPLLRFATISRVRSIPLKKNRRREIFFHPGRASWRASLYFNRHGGAQCTWVWYGSFHHGMCCLIDNREVIYICRFTFSFSNNVLVLVFNVL